MFLTSRICIIQDQRRKKKIIHSYSKKREKYTYIYVYIFYTIYLSLFVFDNIQQTIDIFLFLMFLSIRYIYTHGYCIIANKQGHVAETRKKNSSLY
jgi:hypothetical protein